MNSNFPQDEMNLGNGNRLSETENNDDPGCEFLDSQQAEEMSKSVPNKAPRKKKHPIVWSQRNYFESFNGSDLYDSLLVMTLGPRSRGYFGSISNRIIKFLSGPPHSLFGAQEVLARKNKDKDSQREVFSNLSPATLTAVKEILLAGDTTSIVNIISLFMSLFFSL